MKNEKFDLRDISIIPTIQSDINSRSECDITYGGLLPLIAAPMDTVICKDNAKTFYDNGIIPCLPRGEYIEGDQVFHSYGLNEIEFELLSFLKSNMFKNKWILIDIANGHMTRLLNVVKQIKKNYPHIRLMVGNIGQPLTYKNLAIAGADYVRIGIGGGMGCTTAANVAINYPMGSLIHECRQIKNEFNLKTSIVADGGMQGYDDIIKALALGADFVMLGSLLNKTMQSSGSNHLYGMKISYDLAKTLWKWGFPVKKKYRGMSTKTVQRKWGKTKLVTSEGITKYQKVEYNLTQWVNNFEDYLKSNMSYCGAKNLTEFIGEVEWIYISNNAFRRFQK